MPSPKVCLENRAVVGSVFGTTHREQTVRMMALQAHARLRVVTLLWLNAVFRSLRRDWEPHGRETSAVRPARADFLPCSWLCCPSCPSVPPVPVSLLSVPPTHRDWSHWV